MTRKLLTNIALSVALLACLGAPSSRASVLYDWSFRDVDQGGANTISGTLSLPDPCATSCTGVLATSVILLAAPTGPVGLDFINGQGQLANLFSTTNGVITAASYNGFFGNFGLGGELVFNGIDARGYYPSQVLTDGQTYYFSDGWSHFGEPVAGTGNTLTFSEVPEPATLALLGIGLIGLAAAHSKRARAA